MCVCVCGQASHSQATLSCDNSYFSYWQGTIQASYAVMRQLLFLVVLYGILFILTGNDDIHKSLDEFEIRPDPTTDHRVSCP